MRQSPAVTMKTAESYTAEAAVDADLVANLLAETHLEF